MKKLHSKQTSRSILLLLYLIAAQGFIGCKTTPEGEDDSEFESLKTKFPSTIPELSVGGAHVVLKQGSEVKVIRSMAPTTEKEFDELKAYNITDVVIFKSQTKTEVDDEIEKLKAMGIKSSNIHHVPIGYKGFTNFEDPCQQSVEALQYINEVRKKKNRKMLFHCTVGEDRTGMLAGLVRLLDSDDTVESVFKTEMCKNGYSSGNPKKPKMVTSAIDKDLTPIFVKLAYRIKSGELSWDNLNPEAVCNGSTLPKSAFEMDDKRYKPEDFRCR